MGLFEILAAIDNYQVKKIVVNASKSLNTTINIEVSTGW